jgi:hypothetical protein
MELSGEQLVNFMYKEAREWSAPASYEVSPSSMPRQLIVWLGLFCCLTGSFLAWTPDVRGLQVSRHVCLWTTTRWGHDGLAYSTLGFKKMKSHRWHRIPVVTGRPNIGCVRRCLVNTLHDLARGESSYVHSWSNMEGTGFKAMQGKSHLKSKLFLSFRDHYTAFILPDTSANFASVQKIQSSTDLYRPLWAVSLCRSPLSHSTLPFIYMSSSLPWPGNKCCRVWRSL